MMADKIRFYLDESVERAIADGWMRREIDVTTTPEVELMGVSDEEHLAFALGMEYANIFYLMLTSH